MSMSLFDSSLPLTPPSTPRRGPVPLPDVDDVDQGVAIMKFPDDNALGLFVFDSSLPDGGDPKRTGARRWTHAAEDSKLRRARLRRNRGRRPSYLGAQEDSSAHVFSAVAASTAAPQSTGQNAQAQSHIMPQPVTNATTGEAGSN